MSRALSFPVHPTPLQPVALSPRPVPVEDAPSTCALWRGTPGPLRPVPSLPPASLCTWANLAALPGHFLRVMAGVLSGAGHPLAVLAAVLTGAQDAGQGSKGAESWVPHLPVGVCLPTVHASWAKEGGKGGGSVPQTWARVQVGTLGEPLLHLSDPATPPAKWRPGIKLVTCPRLLPCCSTQR